MKMPRTLHIEDSRCQEGSQDSEAIPFYKLQGQFLVIEEKIDGAGVSIFFDNDLNIQVWHRGTKAISKEYRLLNEWVNNNQNDLFDLLGDRFILFGEWMLNKHTIFYDKLPNYFLESDIYDKEKCLWLSTKARKSLLNNKLKIYSVPELNSFEPSSLNQIKSLIKKSIYQSDNWKEKLQLICKYNNVDYLKCLNETDQSNLMEGLYIKHEDETQVLNRYKFVRFEFVQTILNSKTHLIDRPLIINCLSE